MEIIHTYYQVANSVLQFNHVLNDKENKNVYTN